MAKSARQVTLEEALKVGILKPKHLQMLSVKPEPLRNANSRRAACAACQLFKSCQTPFLKPWVPKRWTGRVLGLGEGPGEHEDQVSLRPSTGPAGQLLYKLFDETGYDYDDIALVNVVRCRPENDAKPNMKQIRACRPFVLQVIKQLQPEMIVTFGGIALKCILNDGGDENVTENRGRLIKVEGVHDNVWCTYNPASVLHGNLHHRERIKEDLTRAGWKNIPWPKNAEPTGQYQGFDTEFVEPGPDMDPPVKERETICAAFSDGKNAHTYLPDDKRLVRIVHDTEKLCPHNGACDIDSLVQLGLCKERWAQGRDIRDSLWLSRLADENRGKGGYKLENLFLSRFKTKEWKFKTEEYGIDPRKWPPSLRDERCRLDAWASLLLAESFLPEARGELQLQHRIGLTLQRIYHAGVYIDLQFLETFAKEVKSKLGRAERNLRLEARQRGMEEFNAGNKNHLRDLLVNYVGVPVKQKTKTGKASIGKLFLKQHKKEYPEIEDALEYSKYEKIYKTYIKATRKLLRGGTAYRCNNRDIQWMPVRINPLGARTLRRSSGADPFDDSEENGLNFQNWTEAVRPLVTTRFKDGGIADNDYHKLEAILQGWLAGEDAMVDFFLNSPNGYIEIGKRLFKKEVKEKTTDYRVVKSIVLGVNYNMKPWYLAHQLMLQAEVMLGPTWEIHLEKTEEIYHQYLGMFRNLRRYIQECADEALRTGKVVMCLGYERRLPIPPEPPRSEKNAWKLWNKYVNHVKNEAANCKAQHLASLVTGTGMLDVEERLLNLYNLSYVDYHGLLMERDWRALQMPLLINEVHDDLVYDVPNAKSKATKEDLVLIKETMEDLPTLRKLMSLPNFTRVDQKIGPSWARAFS